MDMESFRHFISHPVVIGWWGAFGVDFWHWMKADSWTWSDWDWSTATKRWTVGLIMGVIAWVAAG